MAYDAKMSLTYYGPQSFKEDRQGSSNKGDTGAVKSRSWEIHYLRLTVEQSRGKVIRLLDENDGKPNVRKKIIVMDTPMTTNSDADESRNVYDGFGGWVEVKPPVPPAAYPSIPPEPFPLMGGEDSYYRCNATEAYRLNDSGCFGDDRSQADEGVCQWSNRPRAPSLGHENCNMTGFSKHEGIRSYRYR